MEKKDKEFFLNNQHYRALTEDNKWVFGDLVKERTGWGGMNWRYRYWINPYETLRKSAMTKIKDLESISNIDSISQFSFYYDKEFNPIYVGDICENVFIADGYRDAVVKFDTFKGLYFQEICKYCNETSLFEYQASIDNNLEPKGFQKDIKIISNIYDIPMPKNT